MNECNIWSEVRKNKGNPRLDRKSKIPTEKIHSKSKIPTEIIQGSSNVTQQQSRISFLTIWHVHLSLFIFMPLLTGTLLCGAFTLMSLKIYKIWIIKTTWLLVPYILFPKFNFCSSLKCTTYSNINFLLSRIELTMASNESVVLFHIKIKQSGVPSRSCTNVI